MDENDSEVGGGKGRRIQRRAARGSKKGNPKRRAFTEARRKGFLNHFAASCNVSAAARAVGISENCVYGWRRKDAQFRQGFKEALDAGVAALEAEQIRAAREAVKIRRKTSAAVRVGTMDAKTSLAVLEAYRRTQGRDPGSVWPHPYDVEAVSRRLEAKMRLLGLLGAAEDPSTASGGPPPLQRQGRRSPSTSSAGPPPPDELGEDI